MTFTFYFSRQSLKLSLIIIDFLEFWVLTSSFLFKLNTDINKDIMSFPLTALLFLIRVDLPNKCTFLLSISKV